MRRPTPRRLFAALVALLVVCSFGGMPAAATASGDTVLGDGVTAEFDSADGDTETDATEDGDGEDTDDGETTDGEETEAGDGDTDADGGSDGTDEEEGDDGQGADDGGADGEETEARDDGAEGGTDGESTPDGEESSGTSSQWHYNDGGPNGDGGVDDLTEYETEDDESLVPDSEEIPANGDESVGGLESGGDTIAEAEGASIDATDEMLDATTLTISIGALQIELLTYDDTAHGAGAVPADDEALEAVDAPPELVASSRTGDGSTDGEWVAVVQPGDEGDGVPSPPAPGGGAVVAVGTLAAVAAVRSGPFVATEGARAASSTGSSLLSTLLEKVRPFVLPLRYSRYDDSDPLEHEARERVFAIVNEEPGSYLSEVSEEAELPLSTTRHHIKVLEREELLSGAKLRGKRRFYPAYAEGIELAAALNDDSTATIIDAISRFGAASVSDLAEELERDPSTISHHLQRLEEDEIVVRERDGRAVVTRLSSEARTALEPETTPRPGETGEILAGGAD